MHPKFTRRWAADTCKEEEILFMQTYGKGSGTNMHDNNTMTSLERDKKLLLVFFVDLRAEDELHSMSDSKSH
jgi:hypothetical protein